MGTRSCWAGSGERHLPDEHCDVCGHCPHGLNKAFQPYPVGPTTISAYALIVANREGSLRTPPRVSDPGAFEARIPP